MDKTPKSTKKVLSQAYEYIKTLDTKDIEAMTDISTAKEKQRFKKYRQPLTKYAKGIRTSPKKRITTPVKKKSPPKKKSALSEKLDGLISDLIVKISALKEGLLSVEDSKMKRKGLTFIDKQKDKLKDTQDDFVPLKFIKKYKTRTTQIVDEKIDDKTDEMITIVENFQKVEKSKGDLYDELIVIQSDMDSFLANNNLF
jgi:hypothetical protein